MAIAKTTEKFIEEAMIIHSNKYNYNKSEYLKNNIKICIICPIHGEFWQTPSSHLSNHGCPKCGKESSSNLSRFNNNSFIIKANKIHNNKYNYSEVEYVGSKEKVIIICKEHGKFYQEPSSHLRGQGCSKCVGNYKYTTEEFINKANIIHNNKYNYSKTEYINSSEKMCIICPEHGEFWQESHSHLRNHGCPICQSSKGEILINKWLIDNNILFKREFELITPEIARNSNLIKIDFFIKHNEQQYFIEYDGIQHFEYVPYFHKGGMIDFEKEQRRDNVLNDFCELHSDKVTLIRFNYQQSDEEIIQELKRILEKNK